MPESTRPQRVCVLAEPAHARILQAIWHARCLNAPINATPASSDCSWPRHSCPLRPPRVPSPRRRPPLLAEPNHARILQARWHAKCLNVRSSRPQWPVSSLPAISTSCPMSIFAPPRAQVDKSPANEKTSREPLRPDGRRLRLLLLSISVATSTRVMEVPTTIVV